MFECEGCKARVRDFARSDPALTTESEFSARTSTAIAATSESEFPARTSTAIAATLSEQSAEPAMSTSVACTSAIIWELEKEMSMRGLKSRMDNAVTILSLPLFVVANADAADLTSRVTCQYFAVPHLYARQPGEGGSSELLTYVPQLPDEAGLVSPTGEACQLYYADIQGVRAFCETEYTRTHARTHVTYMHVHMAHTCTHARTRLHGQFVL